jgi:alpha-1,6-mannosyltransferase
MAFTSIALYASFAYDLERVDFFKLITLYGALFYLFYTLLKTEKTQLNFLTLLVVLFRLVFLIAIPNLSQDYYRFIWDGRMLLEGWNPYLYLPKTLIEQGIAPMPQAQELYEGMGELSAQHYTNYPPFNQLLFFIASLLSGSHIIANIMILRIMIILSDIGILYIGRKLLQNLEIPDYYIFLYLLNPFIIIELTGNLHFEGIMLFFLLLSLCLIQTNRWKLAALTMALSISIKLLPLLALPLLFQRLKLKKAIIFYTITIATIALLFAPFLSLKFVESYTETLGLWFTKFEFNGSVYNIIKFIGFKIKGYNIIQTTGKITPVIVVIIVMVLTFFRNNKTIPKLITGMLLALAFYFFTSSVVHPWYISTLLLLSVFTKYRFPLLWSLLIFMSYYSYSQANFEENYVLLALQYIPVFALLFYEILYFNKKAPYLL